MIIYQDINWSCDNKTGHVTVDVNWTFVIIYEHKNEEKKFSSELIVNVTIKYCSVATPSIVRGGTWAG